MLDRDQLVSSLKELGIDQESYRVLALLPFVLVAWSDGKVQRAERKRIVELARANGFLTGGGEAILNDWLRDQPLPKYYDAGFKALVELARRERGVGSDMSAQTLRQVIDLSFDVARAAGGLFGQAWSVSVAERGALDTVAELLNIDDGASWSELLEDLGEPESETEEPA